ncbi:MAG: cyclic nucleotide-binding domain-containing protein [Gammaproteobacteria bacterium]|nr:cyclic nucleotide-binding domain-containing protein [Gammaproteobacteria bacterium]
MKRLTRLLLIQEEESGQVLFFLLFFIILGAGLSIGRASADAMFLKRYGIEYLPLVFLGLSLFLGLASMIYATVVDYFPAETFFRGMLSVLAVLLLVSWVCITYFPLAGIYPFYYLLHKVAAELLLVHATLYVSQNFNTLQSKRLSSIIFAGAELGALAGALFTSISASVLGVHNLLLVWLGLGISAILLLTIRHRRTGPSRFFRAQRKSRQPLHGALNQLQEGLVFVWQSSLLKYASLSLLCLVFTFYVLTYSVNRVYTETFTSEESLTAFLAVLIAVNSVLTLLIQVFITNRALLRHGVQRMNLVFPITTVASYFGLIAHFGLPSALLGSFNRDTLIEAIHKPVRSLFFNAVPQYMQGRARAVTVAVVLPLGLLICGITLWLMQQFDSPVYFLAPGLLAALGFLYYNRRMNNAYAVALVDTLKDRVFVPGNETAIDLRAGGDTLLQELGNSLRKHDGLFLSHAKRILTGFPEHAADYLLPELGRVDAGSADWLIGQLLPLAPAGMADAVRPLLTHNDEHLQATALRALIELEDAQSNGHIDAAMHSGNPRLQAVAIHGLLTAQGTDSRQLALQSWVKLLQGTLNEQLAALSLFPALECLAGDTRQQLLDSMQTSTLKLLRHDDSTVRMRVLAACQHAGFKPFPEFGPTLAHLLADNDHRLRAAAVGCIGVLDDSEADTCLLHALEDGHADVRALATEVMKHRATDLVAEITRWLIVENRGNPRAQHTLLDTGIRAGLPASLLRQLAVNKAREASQMKEARRQILELEGVASPDLQLLSCILEERYRDNIDLALQALEPLHEPAHIGIIRAGIRSGDERFVAGACEALTTLDSEPAARELSRMLQDSRQDTGNNSLFTSLDDALQWCRSWAGGPANSLYKMSQTQRETRESDTMSTQNDRILLLKQSNLFREVNIDDLRLVASALSESEYFPGERVFDIGEQGDHLYIIIEGRIGISLSPDPEQKEFVATPGAGEHFGEMNLVDDLPRSATAHVLEKTRLLSLEKGRLRGLILSYPEISLGIMRGLSMVIRDCHRRTAKQA